MLLAVPSGFGDMSGFMHALCIMQYVLEKIKVNFCGVCNIYIFKKGKKKERKK